MKKTRLKQIGKIGRINQKANREIAKLWLEQGIPFCEVCSVLFDMNSIDETWQCGQASSNAHRHGRIWYRGKPELLWAIKQVVRACIKSHEFIDRNTGIKEEVFLTLRGEE